MLGGIGMQEIAIILVVALIFIGPAKLPQVARSIGKGMRELRRASDDLKSAVMVEMDDEEESWRKPAKNTPSKLGAYSDQSVSSSSVAGSLVATGEADTDAKNVDATDGAADGESAEPAHTVSREDAFAAAPAANADDREGDGGPDPMDADDHSGMPFAPDSPQMNDAIEAARAKIATRESDANEAKASGAESSDSKSAAS